MAKKMTYEEIFSLIQKYSLQVKCWPTHKVYQTSYQEGQILKDGETIVEVDLKELGTGKPIKVKRIRKEEFHEPKWGVKVNEWPHWTKYDFYGSTLEEAVLKAVESIR